MSALGSPDSVELTKKFADMIKKVGTSWMVELYVVSVWCWVPGKAAILYDADILGYFNNVPGSSSQAGNLALLRRSYRKQASNRCRTNGFGSWR